MSTGIFLLYAGYPIKATIVNTIQCKTNNVEREKVKVESNYRFSLKINENLRIERNGPGQKINPTEHNRGVNNRLRLCNSNAYK